MAFAHLLSPVQVGPLRLRNRVLVTAHVPGVEADGLASEDYIAYQRAKAAGGGAQWQAGADRRRLRRAPAGPYRDLGGRDGSAEDIGGKFKVVASTIHSDPQLWRNVRRLSEAI